MKYRVKGNRYKQTEQNGKDETQENATNAQSQSADCLPPPRQLSGGEKEEETERRESRNSNKGSLRHRYTTLHHSSLFKRLNRRKK